MRVINDKSYVCVCVCVCVCVICNKLSPLANRRGASVLLTCC
jgi:hypothetical protein